MFDRRAVYEKDISPVPRGPGEQLVFIPGGPRLLDIY